MEEKLQVVSENMHEQIETVSEGVFKSLNNFKNEHSPLDENIRRQLKLQDEKLD